MYTYQMNVKIRGIRETEEDERNVVCDNIFSMHQITFILASSLDH